MDMMRMQRVLRLRIPRQENKKDAATGDCGGIFFTP